jgi:hypothetical protein
LSFRERGLWLTDLEILRLHYAETLRHWRDRFLSHCEGPADEDFRRMREFYLTVSEMSLRFAGFMVFQAQLARQADVLPITHDYMLEQEQSWAGLGLRYDGPPRMNEIPRRNLGARRDLNLDEHRFIGRQTRGKQRTKRLRRGDAVRL